MKKIFGMFKSAPQEKKKVLLITNYQSCQLGKSLAERLNYLIQNDKQTLFDSIVLVAP